MGGGVGWTGHWTGLVENATPLKGLSIFNKDGTKLPGTPHSASHQMVCTVPAFVSTRRTPLFEGSKAAVPASPSTNQLTHGLPHPSAVRAACVYLLQLRRLVHVCSI